MTRRFGWRVAGMLATVLFIMGIGAGVRTFLAYGQDTQAVPASSEIPSSPHQAARPVEGESSMQGSGPLQGAGPLQDARPIHVGGPLQGAGPIQAALPPLATENRPFLPPPNFAEKAPPNFAAGGCSTNDRLATIMGAPTPPSPEVLGMLIKNLKNPCTETAPPPPEFTVASFTPGSTISPPTSRVPSLPPQIVVLPPMVYNPTCQSQNSQTNC